MKIFAILTDGRVFFARQVSGKSGCGAVRSSYLSGVDITPISVVRKRERNYIPDFMQMVGEVLAYVQKPRFLPVGFKGRNGHS